MSTENLYHAWERLFAAVCDLATRDRPLRQRLKCAWQGHLARLDPDEDLPIELAPQLISLRARIEGCHPELDQPLDGLAESHLSALAMEIVLLFSDLSCLYLAGASPTLCLHGDSPPSDSRQLYELGS